MSETKGTSQGEGSCPVLEERRAWVRFPTRSLKTSCRAVSPPGDETPWLPAKVRDLSVNSIGLVLERRFEPGDLLTVELHGNGVASGPTQFRARVVHATADADGRWIIGCDLSSE